MSTGQRRTRRSSARRAALIEDLNLAGREVSTATVMFHSAVAARRGLSATEEKALDLLLRMGPMTHAELCAHTGLAPASVTDLIDRLVRKDYALNARRTRKTAVASSSPPMPNASTPS